MAWFRLKVEGRGDGQLHFSQVLMMKELVRLAYWQVCLYRNKLDVFRSNFSLTLVIGVQHCHNHGLYQASQQSA